MMPWLSLLNNSLCFGLYRNGRQIGFAWVVTDMVETWVIRNLFISPEYRFVGTAPAGIKPAGRTRMSGFFQFILRPPINSDRLCGAFACLQPALKE